MDFYDKFPEGDWENNEDEVFYVKEMRKKA